MRLSQQNGSALSQVANDRSVGRALPAFVDRRTEFCRQVLRFNNVLDPERNIGQLALSRGSLRLNSDPGVNRRVHLLDFVQEELQGVSSRRTIGAKPLA